MTTDGKLIEVWRIKTGSTSFDCGSYAEIVNVNNDLARERLHMVVEDREIRRFATRLIEKYGDRAARIATERLNRMIDRNNARGRDLWACVVHAIHQRQGGDESEPEPVARSRTRRTPAEN